MANNYRRPMQNMPGMPNMQNMQQPKRSCGNCDELLKAVSEADFFAQDLKLYLDTHPDDSRAAEMYVEAVKQYKACKMAFEDCFYPLTAYSAGDHGCGWDWLNGVWAPFLEGK